jgi:hypothetical protein
LDRQVAVKGRDLLVLPRIDHTAHVAVVPSHLAIPIADLRQPEIDPTFHRRRVEAIAARDNQQCVRCEKSQKFTKQKLDGYDHTH